MTRRTLSRPTTLAAVFALATMIDEPARAQDTAAGAARRARPVRLAVLPPNGAREGMRGAISPDGR